ncbi:MAG: hypothetical protein EZS28_030318 [Streblomastix strix]|uniref:Ubiquitin-like domain-containing protein n=1 Tax=Streblomastix strix TaxID=222440 RepID=A0A5J4UU52_9EUKA|nr:MAG: hypothetical protein EZS28_030318 [Streblomastix strix]
MKLTLTSTLGRAYQVEISNKATIADLKQKLEEEHGFPSQSFQLIYNGKQLNDIFTLSDAGIEENSQIKFIKNKITNDTISSSHLILGKKMKPIKRKRQDRGKNQSQYSEDEDDDYEDEYKEGQEDSENSNEMQLNSNKQNKKKTKYTDIEENKDDKIAK